MKCPESSAGRMFVAVLDLPACDEMKAPVMAGVTRVRNERSADFRKQPPRKNLRKPDSVARVDPMLPLSNGEGEVT
jgi:hypothetical protein